MAEKLGIHEPTLRAFTVQPIRVGELDIHPACMAHIMAMRLVAAGFEGGDLTPEEMLSAIVVFSTPPAQASELLNLSSEDWDARRAEIAGKVMLHDLGAYAAAIQQQISSGLAPAIPARDRTDAKAGNFKKKAASAGGSRPLNAPFPNTGTKRK